jgi:predicted dehydrogenase
VVDLRLGTPETDTDVSEEADRSGPPSAPRLHLAASWHAHAGKDCDFAVEVHGTGGSALIRNVDGSFFDFETLLRHGRAEERIALEEGGGFMPRQILAWAERLAGAMDGPGAAGRARFDASAVHDLQVADVLDRVYGWG